MIIDENGNETGENLYISGEEIYNTYRQTEGILDGRVIDDKFFQEMLENIPELKDPVPQSNIPEHPGDPNRPIGEH